MKVPCSSARPYVDFVLGGSVTDTHLTCADTCTEEYAPGAHFLLTSVVCFITFSRPLRLTIVTNHE
jgi:hypothetical protein